MHDFPLPLRDGRGRKISEAEQLYRIAESEFLGVWLPAAKKYMFPKRGNVIDLALRLKITRELEADKRPVAKLSAVEKIIRGERLKARKELDEMFTQATITREGKDFFHRLWKASKIADGKIRPQLATPPKNS